MVEITDHINQGRKGFDKKKTQHPFDLKKPVINRIFFNTIKATYNNPMPETILHRNTESILQIRNKVRVFSSLLSGKEMKSCLEQ